MKLVGKFFALAFIASLFVACGGDEPVDYTLKDLNVLAGDYKGTCEITPSGINGAPYIVDLASVRLVRTQATATMTLETSESGLIVGDILSNFKSTADEKGYTFDIKGFNFTRENSAYISSWLSSLYSEISDVKITVADSKDAKYVKATKTLTFSYTASAKVKTQTLSGETGDYNMNLKYSYTVVKQ
ncbi:MAG: hypothetical protein LBC48_04020 [Dysgonamonadaceae bacterium]|jgi:hypothetical protein|nr:hypothetical protein [Dysgonamonadaceae bacterium]